MSADTERLAELDRILTAAAVSLDLSPSKHQDAVSKYTAVGNFLAEEDSVLAPFNPVIYAQWSLALGTAVKPLQRAEFDIDLVCLLELPNSVSQAQAKTLVGQRLREHKVYADMLEEKNRCWRLNYAGDFHMDILPARPDRVLHEAIEVSDKALKDWKPSHPKGKIEWFKVRCVVTATNSCDSSFSKSHLEARGEVENPPKYDAGRKLPLQRAVQLLKRHRDVMFNRQPDYAPISAVLTILAGHAYAGETSILETMEQLVTNLPKAIQRDQSWRAYVLNPRQNRENYADKWHDDAKHEQEFHRWRAQALRDIQNLRGATGIQRISDALIPILGRRRTNIIMEAEAQRMNQLRQKGLTILPLTATLGSQSASAKSVPRNTFYGDT
jgi:hypothetical protein